MSAVLLTRLKIPDLAAWTALEAGQRLLPAGYSLRRLVRSELYLFEPERGYSTDTFERALERAIATSNFFVNPNKEEYDFHAASDRGEGILTPEGAWGILARPRDETRDEGLRARLLREHPIEGLGAIRRARLWWLWTKRPKGEPIVDVCYPLLGPVTARDRGLLVNPHAEADLLIEFKVPWRSIEDFLVKPPPAIGAAA
jgi:hypothetical protein